MKKKENKKVRGKKKNYALFFIMVILLVLLAIFVLLFSKKGDEENSVNAKNSEIKAVEISSLDLAENKEKYEGKEVKIMNILVPDPLFALVEKPDGNDEKLFIQPQKSVYCLDFNLTGKLQKDASGKRDWKFLVDEFECVSKT